MGIGRVLCPRWRTMQNPPSGGRRGQTKGGQESARESEGEKEREREREGERREKNRERERERERENYRAALHLHGRQVGEVRQLVHQLRRLQRQRAQKVPPGEEERTEGGYRHLYVSLPAWLGERGRAEGKCARVCLREG